MTDQPMTAEHAEYRITQLWHRIVQLECKLDEARARVVELERELDTAEEECSYAGKLLMRSGQIYRPAKEGDQNK